MTTWRLRAIYAAVLLMPASVTADVTVQRDLPYASMAHKNVAARQQSLDLFLPATSSARKAPLVVFVHGGFWQGSDDRHGIGEALAQALAPRGVAVALVRYPLAPTHKFPAQPQYVARALAYLHRGADTYGYDAKRIFLMGHSTGAHLASLVALDGNYLRDVGLPADAFAGVVAISGIYDLRGGGSIAHRAASFVVPVFGSDESTYRTASPVLHARRSAPFLILSAENDFAGFQPDARRFAARLRAVGHGEVQEVVLHNLDHFTLMDMHTASSLARELVLNFIGEKPLDQVTDVLMRARRTWQEPPFTTEVFWQREKLVRAYPVDERFKAALRKVYEYSDYELKSYPLKSFHGIELARYLETQAGAKLGSGDHLVLTNLRQEKTFWRVSEIMRYQPVLVVGVDDERNLFRLAVFYQNKLEHSWKSETPFLSARPVGGFIYFLKPPPASLTAPTLATYALTPESFRRSETDPLARMADLPQDLYETLHFRNACFSCHSFRGTDVRAGHLRARNGELQGGFALALESYAPEVWRQFMFENDKSAAAIGVRLNAVIGPVTNKLYKLVEDERARSAPSKTR